jgi:ribonuclease HI
MIDLNLYCDGSSTGRSNKEFGWAFVIIDPSVPREKNELFGMGAGGGFSGTNNIAELTGAIEGFEWLFNTGHFNPKKYKITLISDSQYVLNMAQSLYKPTKNLVLVNILQILFKSFEAKARWVKGHSGKYDDDSFFNNYVDGLAKMAKSKFKP